jgi:hypothetical protein
LGKTQPKNQTQKNPKNSKTSRSVGTVIAGRNVAGRTGQAQDTSQDGTKQVLDKLAPPSLRASIIWTRYRAVGVALERLGLPYYGLNGLDSQGRYVEQADGDAPIVASIRSCGTGCNLQAFNRNLVLTQPGQAGAVEQLISRTHREGQQADTIYCDWIRSIPEHAETLRELRKQADRLTAQGDKQRLSIGTWR